VASVERTTPSRHLSPSLASSCRSFCYSRACGGDRGREEGGRHEREPEEGEEGESGDNNGKGAVTFDSSVLYMMRFVGRVCNTQGPLPPDSFIISHPSRYPGLGTMRK